MSRKRLDRFGRPLLFRSIERGDSNRSFTTGSVRSIYNTNITSENSFKYEPYGSPLKSTQQLSVDYSKFENHTFFNSANAKTRIAFNKIINKYPFDGSLYEVEEFEDKLTGYEKYVLDSIPKYDGYLTLTGSGYIEVKNVAGSSFPEYSSKKSGSKIIDPEEKSFSFECFLAVPDNETITDMGIFHVSGSDIKIEAVAIESLSTDTHYSASFRIVSGSEDRVVYTDPIKKGEFNHLSFVLNKNNGQKIETFVNGKKQERHTNINTKKINFLNSMFLFQSGTFKDENDVIRNYTTFSGSAKDARIYHHARNESLILKDYKESIYKSDDLVLNFRFNEPTGSYAVKKYVLDTSGNSLHSEIKTDDSSDSYFDTIRASDRYLNPVTNENKKRSHVLFPDYQDLVNLNKELISSGTLYDNVNPNLITRLIPPHYFEEILFETGESSPENIFKEEIEGKSIPGSANSIKTNLLNVLLFSWANIFDEVKMFIDSFGNVIFSDYNDNDIVPDQLILYAAKHLGVELPPIFTSSVSEDFFDSKNIYSSTSTKNLPLKRIQSIIWKRILTDASYYRKTKGTIESLKTVFRSSGIDPDKMFSFVEKGSNTVYAADENEIEKIVEVPMINFSGSNADVAEGTLNRYGFSPNKPHIVTSEMISDNGHFFTSGSWAFEGYYSFPRTIKSGSKESLARIQRNHYDVQDYTDGILGTILNIIATKDTHVSLTGSEDTLTAYFTDEYEPTSSNVLKMTGVNIFDGDLWYVSFSKTKESDLLNLEKDQGDIYTLRCFKCGTSNQMFSTSSLVEPASTSIQNEDTPKSTLSGSQVLIGSQSVSFGTLKGLNNIGDSNENYQEINYTGFSGKVSSIRFWSKFLTEKESINHAKDSRNYGTEDPNKNSMFLSSSDYFSRAYGRIRLHIDGNQPVTSSINQKIILNDFTQNEKDIEKDSKSFAQGFESEKTINSFEKFSYLIASNKFDEPSNYNKIRIRSLEENKEITQSYQSIAPVYNIFNNHEANDDARFSVEMSIARILNEKINNEIAGVSFFENVLGKANNDFAETYNEIEFFANNFFKNTSGDINIEKLLSVYTWLEASFEKIIEKSLPKKTKFLGMNYVVEPHNLERSKVRLYNEGAYLKEEENNEKSQEENRVDVFTGEISKF